MSKPNLNLPARAAVAGYIARNLDPEATPDVLTAEAVSIALKHGLWVLNNSTRTPKKI